jgi:hypothetical protein
MTVNISLHVYLFGVVLTYLALGILLLWRDHVGPGCSWLAGSSQSKI